MTFDEPTHLAAGVTYWTEDRYDYNPEAGNLPQRLAALPLVLGGYRLPESISNLPSHPELMGYAGQEVVFGKAGQAQKILLLSRAMMLILEMGLGAMIYYWSRLLFGPLGGMISLTLFVFCPNFLANSPLITSDTASALFFPAALGAIWLLLHRLSPGTLLLAALATTGAFLSKMSAPLLLPVVLLLLLWRLAAARPMRLRLPGFARIVQDRRQLALWTLGSLLFIAFFVWVMIWASFGFRFIARPPGNAVGLSLPSWDFVLGIPGRITSTILWARDHHFLPEAYLYGFATAKRFSTARAAFLLGQISPDGWKSFFPIAFLIKTPAPTLMLLLLALWAGISTYWKALTPSATALKKKCVRTLYRTAPLWSFFSIYWLFAVTSHLNIGLRHLLPTYTIVYILAGALGVWIVQSRATLRMSITGVLLFFLTFEAFNAFPHYMTYFNEFVGGPKNGYKFLVDSSLDWGQDLPDLKSYLDEKGLQDPKNMMPVYLSYFGNGDIRYYGIRALVLPGFNIITQSPMQEVYNLAPGTYCMSATLLQGVYWQEYLEIPNAEDIYQSLQSAVNQFLALGNNQPAKESLYEQIGIQAWDRDAFTLQQLETAHFARQLSPADEQKYAFFKQMRDEYQAASHNPAAIRKLQKERGKIEWENQITFFQSLRMARLSKYLRERNEKQPPDAVIDNTIFIYTLTAEDLAALNKPQGGRPLQPRS